MGKKTEFLYLSEPDLIQVGVLDAACCTDVAEEVFELLSIGDYLMGGSNHNGHGFGIVFPKETPFPNMPVAGPDRRFMAMPAYLGGRFDVCGNKWYGSNAANTSRGLPRSVLTLMLNDKDTGEPLTLMSANLISAARTGAVPAVAVRYLARKDSEVITVLGCGPINQACYRTILSQMPGIKKAVCFDLFLEKAQAFAAWSEEELGIPAVASDSLEDSIKAGDVITIAASRLKPLIFEDKWVKKGATVLFTGPANSDESFWTDCTVVYDNNKLHMAYVQEAIESGDKEGYYKGVIGGPLYSLIDKGKLPTLENSVSMGDIVRGIKPGRQSDDERIAFIACGMAVFDVALGYDLYKRALEMGVGTKLLLWEEALQS
jgi:ornithine cyclodeaminase